MFPAHWWQICFATLILYRVRKKWKKIAFYKNYIVICVYGPSQTTKRNHYDPLWHQVMTSRQSTGSTLKLEEAAIKTSHRLLVQSSQHTTHPAQTENYPQRTRDPNTLFQERRFLGTKAVRVFFFLLWDWIFFFAHNDSQHCSDLGSGGGILLSPLACRGDKTQVRLSLFTAVSTKH